MFLTDTTRVMLDWSGHFVDQMISKTVHNWCLDLYVVCSRLHPRITPPDSSMEKAEDDEEAALGWAGQGVSGVSGVSVGQNQSRL